MSSPDAAATPATRDPADYVLYASEGDPESHLTLLSISIPAPGAPARPSVRVEYLNPVPELAGDATPSAWTFAPREGCRVGPDDDCYPLAGPAASLEEALAALSGAGGAAPGPPPAPPVLVDARAKTVVSANAVDIARRLWGLSLAAEAGVAAEAAAETKDGDMEQLQSLRRDIYAAGLATEQAVYETHARRAFATLDALDERLSKTRFLRGNAEPGVADWVAYTLLWRFDAAFYPLFKLARQRLHEFAQLGPYLRDLHSRASAAGGAGAVDMQTMKAHYFLTWGMRLSGRAFVPRGNPDLLLPHDRHRFEVAEGGGGGGGGGAASATDDVAVAKKGDFVRPKSNFRNWVSRAPGAKYPAAKGRYHLYIANNCPWCHRTALMRALKGLEDVVSMDVCFYRRHPEHGWQFRPEEPGCTPDTVNGVTYIKDLYERFGSKERSVPVLWDKETGTIVSNESAEIIRMFNDAFVDLLPASAPDLYPRALRPAIEHLNAWTYPVINNGTYKAGFAKTQEAYERAFDAFFDGLDRLEAILSRSKWLAGDQVTEADVRVFPTLFRFDAVYFTRFRLNKKRIQDYVHLGRWLKQFYHHSAAVAAASNLDHCVRGYFGRTGDFPLVPIGPAVEF